MVFFFFIQVCRVCTLNKIRLKFDQKGWHITETILCVVRALWEHVFRKNISVLEREVY